MSILVVAGVIVAVLFGVVVEVLGLPRWGVERQTLSARDDLPNTAAEWSPFADVTVLPHKIDQRDEGGRAA